MFLALKIAAFISEEQPERFSVFFPTIAFVVGEGYDIFKEAERERENYVLDPASEMHPLKEHTSTSRAKSLAEKSIF